MIPWFEILEGLALVGTAAFFAWHVGRWSFERRYLTGRLEDDDARVELFCDETRKLVATDATIPSSRDEERNVAIYDCPHCEQGRHAFLWGPPAPILVDSVLEEGPDG